MLLKQGTSILTRSQKNGIDIRKDTVFCAWAQKDKMTLETPVRFQGGEIQLFKMGAFSYVNDKAYIRAVRSIGRFCAIGPEFVAGMPEHSVKSVSHHILFPDQDSVWCKGFTDYFDDNDAIVTIKENQNKELNGKGMIEIGHNVWIGGRVTILRGCKIGDCSIIAAGSVVTKDVPAYSIVGGVPAKVIKYRYSDEQIERMEKLRWWEYGPSLLKGCDITDVDATLDIAEERVSNGFEKYSSDWIVLDPRTNEIRTESPL